MEWSVVEMDKERRVYIAIDLKSFYASVECVERRLEPLENNLVVADVERSEKTICLAVSPSLKSHGIPGRPRLFEVIQKVNEINFLRGKEFNWKFKGKSYNDAELRLNPRLKLDYIVAKPRMSCYIEYSKRIYEIYLRYIAPEDIHMYSIDEVFIDATNYLKLYRMSGKGIAMTIIKEIKSELGITATAGIGTNLYLAKVAMDIVAKHIHADSDGVRVSELDEYTYRKLLWKHTPITDFWRVGRGYAKKLLSVGINTMEDIARCSIGRSEDYYNEDLLYNLFGVNAELLIDHAWGWEPCTIKDIKSYKPSSKSLGSGQVLHHSHDFESALIVVKEMAYELAINLTRKNSATNQIVLTIGYDVENLINPSISKNFRGKIKIDGYGRKIPEHSHGTINLESYTSSYEFISQEVTSLYMKIVNPKLLIKRIYLTANRVEDISRIKRKQKIEQIDFFKNYSILNDNIDMKDKSEKRDLQIQKVAIEIKKRYGKNSLVKGLSLMEGATAIERNLQIGGHKA